MNIDFIFKEERVAIIGMLGLLIYGFFYITSWMDILQSQHNHLRQKVISITENQQTYTVSPLMTKKNNEEDLINLTRGIY